MKEMKVAIFGAIVLVSVYIGYMVWKKKKKEEEEEGGDIPSTASTLSSGGAALPPTVSAVAPRSPYEGTFVRGSDSIVYYISGGKKHHWICLSNNPAAQQQKDYFWNQSRVIAQSQINSIPVGSPSGSQCNISPM